MKAQTFVCILTALFTLASAPCIAEDFGSKGDIGTVRADARILLAHQARLAGIDPKLTVVSGVIVSKDTALLSWQIGPDRGVLGLMRLGSRWWGTFAAVPRKDGWAIQSSAPFKKSADDVIDPKLTPALLKSFGFADDLLEDAVQRNSDISPDPANVREIPPFASETTMELRGKQLNTTGGTVAAWGSETAGYAFSMRYSANDAPATAEFSQVYGRAPTKAEFLPYPTPDGFYSSDAVFYFDLTIDATKPVTFAPGSRIFVWFPFVLDDTLRYNLTIGFADKPIGPVYATAFDNTLEFELPAFTVVPGKQLMAEIDGDRH